MRFLGAALAARVACQSAQAWEPAGTAIPATDRVWHGSDYASVYKELASRPDSLPESTDGRGAALLQRITALENLEQYRDKRIPIEGRFGGYVELQKETASITLLYYAASLKKTQDLKAELASLFAFSLHVSAVGVELVDEVIPTFKKDDKYETRLAGVQKMYSGLTTQFVGSEALLTESNGFSMSERSVVLEAMAKTLPTVKNAFSPAYRVELRDRLKSDRSFFSSADDLQRIDMMISELGT